jgi:hypothetical protein
VLVLHTDGLVEVRDQAIDQRLQALTDLLAGPRRCGRDTCDLLLSALCRTESTDDVALLIAPVAWLCGRRRAIVSGTRWVCWTSAR